MNIHTPEHATDMVNAIAGIFTAPALALQVERTIQVNADRQVQGYNGGMWNFHSNGTTGFWAPDMPVVPVSCENCYQNEAMDPLTFGAGITLLSLNQLVWRYYETNPDQARTLQDIYDALYAWAYGDDSPLDIAQLHSYLD